MKSIKKTFILMIGCLFVLVMILVNVFGDIAKAETSDSKILNYNEGAVLSEKIYKDKALIQISYKGENQGVYYFSNSKAVQVGNYVESDLNESKEIISEYNKKEQGVGSVFDLEQGKITGSYDLNELDDTLKKQYGKDDLNIGRLRIADNKNGIWYIYSIVIDHNIKSQGVLTPGKKISEMEVTDFWLAYTTSSDKFYGIIQRPSQDSDLTYSYLRIIGNDGTTKDIKIDERVSRNYDIRKIIVSNNKIYAHLESRFKFRNGEKDIDGYYELIENNEELSKGAMLLGYTDVELTKDSNECIWYVKDGVVYKFDNNQWVMKYEVDRRMNRIVAYDDDNFVLSYSFKENERSGDNNTTIYSLDGIYTLVQAGKNVTLDKEVTQTQNITGSGQNSSTPINITTEKAVVSLVKDGVLPIQVSKLDRSAVNLVEVLSTSNTNKLEVTIKDIKAIKEGTGSVQAKIGQNTLINLPFSAIDKSLLTDTAKVILSTSAESNTALVKGLKAVKKLYSFDIVVGDGEKKTAVHKLANGDTEITFTLSAEELKGLNKSNLATFLYNEDTKKFEYMETKVDGNKISFKTSHFSKFIISEKSRKNKEILPKAETRFETIVIVTLGSIFVLLGIVFLKRKKDIKVNR